MTLIEENTQKKEVSNNPYDVLGISRTSSSEKARKVFLEKCKRLHPDKRREEEEENNSRAQVPVYLKTHNEIQDFFRFLVAKKH